MRAVRRKVSRRVCGARDAALRAALEGVLARCDVAARRAADPVSFVHRYAAPHDQEIVALVASAMAFGNVTTIRKKIEELLAVLGPSPAAAGEDGAELGRRLRGFRHRVFRGEDVARLVAGARAVQRAHGSLGARFAADLAREGSLRPAIGAFAAAIRLAGGLRCTKDRRGPAHILPSAAGSSGLKRFLLFLRWMVRRADGVDLGLWSSLVPASRLVVPVDTHVHKLARNLGFTRREDAGWKTAEEITAALARFDPDDPVRFDFALCHLGMIQRCPSRRDAVRCRGCPVQPVCRHWA